MGLAFRWACFLLLLLAVVYPTTTLFSHDASKDPAFEHFQDHAPGHPEAQHIDLRPSHTKQLATGNLLVQHLPRQEPEPPRHMAEWWAWCSRNPEPCQRARQEMQQQVLQQVGQQNIRLRESSSSSPDYHEHLPRDDLADPHTAAWWCEQSSEVCQEHIHQRDSGSPGPDYHGYCRYHPGLRMCQSVSLEQRRPVGLPHECMNHPKLPVCNILSLQQRQAIGVPHYCLTHTELLECNPRTERRRPPISKICKEHPELPTCHSLQQRQSPYECRDGSISSACHPKIKERDSHFRNPLWGWCRQYPEHPACSQLEEICAQGPGSCPPNKIIKRKETSCTKVFGIFWWSSCTSDGGPLPVINEDSAETNDWENTEDEFEDLYEDWYDEHLAELIEQEWRDFLAWLLEHDGDSDFDGFEERAVARYRSVAQHSPASNLTSAHLFRARANSAESNSTQQSVSPTTKDGANDLFTEILLYVLLGLIGFGILSLAVFVAARRFMRNSTWTPTEDCSGPLTPTKFSSIPGTTAGGRDAYGSTGRDDEEAQRAMIERSTGTGIDGVNDGWTQWIQNRRGVELHTQKRTPSTPRIPSLTLPKPTFATVRKVSGLPDLDSAAAQKLRPSAGEKCLSKPAWTSTV